jgi:hypothetical protein
MSICLSQYYPFRCRRIEAISRFMKAQDEWERFLREQKELVLEKIKVARPFSPFRARLAAALPWMMAHQRRHFVAGRNVKRQIVSTAPKTASQAG